MDFSAANGKFTLDLFKKLGQASQGENVFISPFTISASLSMLLPGARNNTAIQIAEVLHLNTAEEIERSSQEPRLGKGEIINSEFQKLISEVTQPSHAYLIKIANRLYVEKAFNFINEYLQLAKKYYQSEPQAVDFFNAPEQARNQINSWVEEQTDKKIENLLLKGAVDSQTTLVLINVIYFKGKWEKRFQEENTTETPFRLSKIQSKPVQMMFLKDTFPIFYVDTLNVFILELPYVSNEFSMLILLPDDIMDESTGLEMLEKELTYEKLSIWTSPEMMEKTEVEVYLPKIKLEENYDLRSILESMGIKDAFNQNQADFSEMSRKNNLFLSQVFHKAFVEVSEEGTEAAAATGAVILMRSSLRPVKIIADHPFLFLIRHNKTQTLLLLGRFCSP